MWPPHFATAVSMSGPAEPFRDYLAEDESVVLEIRGTLVDDRNESDGTIGVTDRRVIFRSHGDQFVDIAHDAILSIQSRPKTSYTARGIGWRLLTGLSALVAVVSFVAVVGFGAGITALGFMALTVVGAAGAEYVRRNDIEPDWVGIGPSIPMEDGRLRRLVDRTVGRADGNLLGFGLAYLGLLGVVGLVVVTGSLAAILLVVLTLGGLALADVTYRHIRTVDRIGQGRRREREVGIHLADGRRFLLRTNAADPIDQALSGAARDVADQPAATRLGEPAESRA